MPALNFDVTDAQAARMVAAYRSMPAPDGTTPAPNATNAQLWAHVKKCVGMNIRQVVKQFEQSLPDDLDALN